MTTEDPVAEHIRRRMQRTRGRDTEPELALRRTLHAMGYRYRVNARPEPSLRRTADLLFTKARVAVFVDGCFWHRCPEHFVMPRTRTEFWQAKIDRNVARDLETTAVLEHAGWTVIRVWEHEPLDRAVHAVVGAVGPVRR